jgi:hypothetical protein
MPELEWMRYFPRARDIEMRMFPSTGEVMRLFATVRLSPVAFVAIEEQLAPSLTEYAERLRLRALSTFEHMSEEEIAQGFARMDVAVAEETQPQPVVRLSDLLVFG